MVRLPICKRSAILGWKDALPVLVTVTYGLMTCL
jgi:hypothetical protein